MYVGDLAHRDGLGVHVPEPVEDGQLLVPADAEGLVELPAHLVYVGDLAHRDGLGVHVPEPVEDGQLLVPADAEGLVELPARLVDVGAEPRGEGCVTILAPRGVMRHLGLRRAVGELQVTRFSGEVSLVPEELGAYTGVVRHLEPPRHGAEPGGVGAACIGVVVAPKPPRHRPRPVQPRHPLRHGLVLGLQGPPPRAAGVVGRLGQPLHHPGVHTRRGGVGVGEAPQVLGQELVYAPPDRRWVVLHDGQAQGLVEPVLRLGLSDAHDGRQPADADAAQGRHAEGAQGGQTGLRVGAEALPQRVDGEAEGGGEGAQRLAGRVLVRLAVGAVGRELQQALVVQAQEVGDGPAAAKVRARQGDRQGQAAELGHERPLVGLLRRLGPGLAQLGVELLQGLIHLKRRDGDHPPAAPVVEGVATREDQGDARQALHELGGGLGQGGGVEVVEVQQGALVLKGHLHPRREVAGAGLKAQTLGELAQERVGAGRGAVAEGDLEVAAGETRLMVGVEALDEEALAHARHALQVAHHGGLGFARGREQRRRERRELRLTANKLGQGVGGWRRAGDCTRLGLAEGGLPDEAAEGGVLVQRGVWVPVAAVDGPSVELYVIPQRAALGVHHHVDDVEAVHPPVLLVPFVEAARGEGAQRAVGVGLLLRHGRMLVTM